MKAERVLELLNISRPTLARDGKVEHVVITHKDRLSRVAFNMFEHLFKCFDCKIIVVTDKLDLQTDKDELFEEIVNLLHCFQHAPENSM